MTERSNRTRAFTLTELIVVVSIVVILLAVSIPTFRSTLASTASSAAETKLRLASLSARDAAVNSDLGNDTALVFVFEPGSVMTMLVCELVGSFTDYSGRQVNGQYPERDLFVPVSRFDPIQFPEGWMVRGLVPLGTVAQDDDWYDGGTYDFTESRNWVFPETGFYDALVVDDGADRQSFMIRYRAVTGEVDIGSGREAMVLDPRPTTTGRMNRRPYSDYRFDRGSDLAQLARHALLRDDFRALGGGSNDPLTLLFGEDSGDTVLCRPVTEVVLYRETDLAAAVSTRVDAATGSLYVAGDDPEYDRRVRSPEQQRKIARWLEGDTNFDEEWDMPLGDDQPVARIYSFQRYTARVQEVPLVDLDAVASEYGPGGGQ